MKLLVAEADTKVAKLRDRLRSGGRRGLFHTTRGVGCILSADPPDDAAP